MPGDRILHGTRSGRGRQAAGGDGSAGPEMAVDQIAYVVDERDGRRIHIRRFDESAPHRLEDTAGAQLPFFSPDGRWLAFFADGSLKKLPLRGGAAVTLCDAPFGMGGAWSPDGWIVFGPSDTANGLRRVADTGGQLHRHVLGDEDGCGSHGSAEDEGA